MREFIYEIRMYIQVSDLSKLKKQEMINSILSFIKEHSTFSSVSGYFYAPEETKEFIIFMLSKLNDNGNIRNKTINFILHDLIKINICNRLHYKLKEWLEKF